MINKMQKKILLIGLVLVALNCLVPPRIRTDGKESYRWLIFDRVNREISDLGEPRHLQGWRNVTIYQEKLIAYTIAIIAIMFIFLLIFGKEADVEIRETDENEKIELT